MFFVITNKPFLQTEGHRGYGTPTLYNFLFLISYLSSYTRKSFANAINRAAVKQALRPASGDSKLLQYDSELLKHIIYKLEKRRTRNLDEIFGVQKSVFEITCTTKNQFFEKYIISKTYLTDSVCIYFLLHEALLILVSHKKNFFYNYDLISKL